MNKTRRRSIILISGAVLAAAGGVALQRSLIDHGEEALMVANLWTLPLQDFEGNAQPLTRWKGKILVVNFWATWCEPCRAEIPGLVRIQDKLAAKNVQIVGISIDSVAKVKEFAKEFKVQYPLVMGGMDAIEITRKLGNKVGGLPYTVVLDRNGVIKARHLGGITEADLESAIVPLLNDVSSAHG